MICASDRIHDDFHMNVRCPTEPTQHVDMNLITASSWEMPGFPADFVK
jgi:hypothetical protein